MPAFGVRTSCTGAEPAWVRPPKLAAQSARTSGAASHSRDVRRRMPRCGKRESAGVESAFMARLYFGGQAGQAGRHAVRLHQKGWIQESVRTRCAEVTRRNGFDGKIRLVTCGYRF